MTHRLSEEAAGCGESSRLPSEPKREARPCQYRSSIGSHVPASHLLFVNADAATLIQDRDRAGPAGGAGPYLDRKAAHLEAGRRQAFQIVQLLEMAIADLAAGLVALPDQARIAGLGKFLGCVHERRIPAPAVDSGDPHAPLQQIERGLPPHAATGRDIMRLAIQRAGGG